MDKPISLKFLLRLGDKELAQRTLALLATENPRVKISEIQSLEEVPPLLEAEAAVVLVWRADDLKQAVACLEMIQAQSYWIEEDRLAIILLTRLTHIEGLEKLEKRKLVQIVDPGVTAKALKIKVDYLSKALESRQADKKRAGKKFKFTFKAEPRAPLPPGSVRLAAGPAAPAKPEANYLDRAADDKPAPYGRSASRPATIPGDAAQLKDRKPPVEIPTGKTSEKSRHLMLLSGREEDVLLATRLSKEMDACFHWFHDPSSLAVQELLSQFPETTVLWEVDPPGAMNIHHPSSIQAVGLMLSKASRADRVFALSDTAAYKLGHLANFHRHVFNHHICRRNDEGSLEVYGRLMRAAQSGASFGLEAFIENGTGRQLIQLKNSNQRGLAVEALQKYLVKRHLAPRLAVKVAQAADELLLNAVFDAPIDANGKNYRSGSDRSSEFAFTEKEQVTLELLSNSDCVGICIRDKFGSARVDALLSVFQYPDATDSWDLRKVLETGVSLIYTICPGVSSEAILLFPKSQNYIDLKRKFRFFSIVSQVPK